MTHATTVFDDIELVMASGDADAAMIISLICRMHVTGHPERIDSFAEVAYDRGFDVSIYQGAVFDTLILKGNSLGGIRVPL